MSIISGLYRFYPVLPMGKTDCFTQFYPILPNWFYPMGKTTMPTLIILPDSIPDSIRTQTADSQVPMLECTLRFSRACSIDLSADAETCC